MRRPLQISVLSVISLVLFAAVASAAQGPGVGPGGASAVAQIGAAAIVGGLAAVVVFGLVKLLSGRGSMPWPTRSSVMPAERAG